jgi:hypothetical protein
MPAFIHRALYIEESALDDLFSCSAGNDKVCGIGTQLREALQVGPGILPVIQAYPPDIDKVAARGLVPVHIYLRPVGGDDAEIGGHYGRRRVGAQRLDKSGHEESGFALGRFAFEIFEIDGPVNHQGEGAGKVLLPLLPAGFELGDHLPDLSGYTAQVQHPITLSIGSSIVENSKQTQAVPSWEKRTGR